MAVSKSDFKAWVELLDREIPTGSSVDQILTFLERLSAALARAERETAPHICMMEKKVIATVIYGV